MKNSICFSILVAFATLSVFAQNSVGFSNTWYGDSTSSTIGSVDVSFDSGTSTISVDNTGTNGDVVGAVTGLNQTVSLDNIGDFIQFTGVLGGSLQNNKNYGMRVGFYHSGGATIDSDFDADMDSLDGVWAGLGTRNGGSPTGGLGTQDDANPFLRLDQTAGGGNFNTGSHAGVWNDDLITFRIERIIGDEFQVTALEGANTMKSAIRTLAQMPTTSFDTLAIAIQTNGTASFSDIEVTTIPEPGTLALIGIFLGAVLMGLKRRR